MTSTLRIDPTAVRKAGSVITDIASAWSKVDTGAALTTLSGSVPGFQSGAAAAQTGSVLDHARKSVVDKANGFADKLKSAADAYEKADHDLAQKIKDKAAEKFEKKTDEPGGGDPSPNTPTDSGDGIDLSNLTPEQQEFVKNFQLPESAVPAQFRGNIPEYRKNILQAAIKNGIPPEVLAAQIEQESGWDPNIQNFEGRDSFGLSQSEPGAWAQTPTGRANPITDQNRGTAADPRKNIQCAINAQAEYDRWCHENGNPLYPNDPLRSMLDGYNGGIGNPQAAESQNYYQNTVDRMHKYQIDPSAGAPKLGVPSNLVSP